MAARNQQLQALADKNDDVRAKLQLARNAFMEVMLYDKEVAMPVIEKILEAIKDD